MRIFLVETAGAGSLPEAYRRAAQAQLGVQLSQRPVAPGGAVLFLTDGPIGPCCPVLGFQALRGEVVVLPEAAGLPGRVCWRCNQHCVATEGLTADDVSPSRCAVQFWLEMDVDLRLPAGEKVR